MPLTKIENKRILSAYGICNGNAAEATRYLTDKYKLNVTSVSVRKKWKMAGYKKYKT